MTPMRTAALSLLLLTLPLRAAEQPPAGGQQLYAQKCASCHGAKGEGVADKYPKPLVGDRSLGQLSKYIARTMPEDDPGSVVGPDADRVAAFIHEAFYSPTAQDRNRPARIELARLTVRQYRNAVADGMSVFRPAFKPDGERGLRGEYFNSRSPRKEKRLIDRRDPTVSFDFGHAGPDPATFDHHTFSAAWSGAVFAPDTGEYEFAVRSDQSVRFWINETQKPAIDGFVRSANETEYKLAIPLLGGRWYAIRLEFSKGAQGDAEGKKQTKPAGPAFVSLEWTTPKRAREVIPERHLSPLAPPSVYVVSTAFPPDDKSVGYERGTAVSKAWDQAATEAATDAAAFLVRKGSEFGGTDAAAPDRAAKLKAVARKFAERLFRRPLTPAAVAAYVDRPFDTADSPDEGLRRAAILALKSPRFLFREPGRGGDAYDTAARLSFALTDSLPDAELLKAAAANQLATPAQVRKHADRLLADSRTRGKLRGFFHHWLKVDPIPDLAKDAAKFPGFDLGVASDLRASLDLFLDDVAWGDRPDFRRLLLSDDVYLNGRLSKFYGGNLSDDAGFTRVTLPGERAGVLTHPYLLAGFAHAAESSPIHRGVFLARSILGRSLRPPMEAFAPLAPDLHPKLTTRQRVALQTQSQACMGCHAVINPLGFSLEQYDAAGRFRTTDNGQPVDARGEFLLRDGKPIAFGSVRELAQRLADSEETHDAFVEQVFQHVVKQPIRAYGPTKHAELRAAFTASGCDVRQLLVAIATTAALP